MAIPGDIPKMAISFLPPMSGLADREFYKQSGEIGFLLGQGQTAEVLRNMCFKLFQIEQSENWNRIVSHLQRMFGITLAPPDYKQEVSEIVMTYTESGRVYDLSCSGRGLQQVLLLLTHLYLNPGSVLLLDEPDAHLEILRQREVYNLVSEVAREQKSQVIAASHSEVVLNEAAGRHQVIAFVGKPHSITDRGSQVLKSLKDIGFEDYYQAEESGWVLYLEDSTDLAILHAFATFLQHPALPHLERPFVHYAGNLPSKAREHFRGLCEGKRDLRGIAIFDRLDKKLQDTEDLVEFMWERREIENYFCSADVLLRYSVGREARDLFSLVESDRRRNAMEIAITKIADAIQTLDHSSSPWSPDAKASDDVIAPIMRVFAEELGEPLPLRKRDFWQLVYFLQPDEVSPEVVAKLDAIVEVASNASPGGAIR